MNKIILMKHNLLEDENNYCPIIVSCDGVVLDGNHRVIAARLAGIKTLKAVVIPASIVEISVDDLQLGWQPNTRLHWTLRLWAWLKNNLV